jgi:type II secretory pathway pseudopilin PulG
MQTKIKKTLLILVSILVIVAASYVLFITSFVTHGFRDYVQFCSLYIEKIDDYKSQTGHYPDTLQKLTKPPFSWRYKASDCYYYSQPNFYGFAVKHGLIGQRFYYSDSNKWLSD